MTDSTEFVCLSFFAYPDEQEILLAALQDLPFEGFEQHSNRLDAYMASRRWSDQLKKKISDIASVLEISPNWNLSELGAKNWSTAWQDKIEPVQAGIYYIHPPWLGGGHMASGSIPIMIEPRMSFGTGLHESTRLALLHLSDEFPCSDPVLDMGTGTGILAIAAALSGSSKVTAVDNDKWSISNARDNIRLNHVSDRIDLRLGSLENVHDQSFSLIMANINEKALNRMIPMFKRLVGTSGKLILSGLTGTDEDKILLSLSESGFKPSFVHTEGEWWSVKAEPKG